MTLSRELHTRSVRRNACEDRFILESYTLTHTHTYTWVMGGGSERKNERKEENPHRVAVAARFKTAFKTSISRLGPYHVEYTPSRPIWEVKQRRAWLVLAWVTGWEYHVFKPLFLTFCSRRVIPYVLLKKTRLFFSKIIIKF